MNLALPWTIDPPIEGFSRDGFTKYDWDVDGKLSNGEHFFLGDYTATVADLEGRLGTASMVTRWREAHPELVGTDEDAIVKTVREFREILGCDEMIFGQNCHLLLIKKD